MGTAHVLIADDEPAICDVIAEYLREEGYEVSIAHTAVGALAQVKDRAPDVVLLDLMMPGAMTGDAAVAALSRFTAVVVMTGISDVERARRTLHAGAFDFVMKPASLTHLGAVVEVAALSRRDRDTRELTRSHARAS